MVVGLPTYSVFCLQLVLVTGINQTLGISNEWFAIGDSLVLTVLGQVLIPASFAMGFISSLLESASNEIGV
jgi:hypothetical protein